MKFNKILGAVSAAAVAVSMFAANIFAAEIWSGSLNFEDWSKSIIIEAGDLAGVNDGDTVTVTYSANDGAEYYNLKAASNTDGWPILTCTESLVNDWGSIEPDPNQTSYSFDLNAADVEVIKASGMVIQGYGITVTKVEIGGAAAEAPVEEETPVVEETDETPAVEEEVVTEAPEVTEAEVVVTDAPATLEEPVTEAPAADANTTPVKTGNVPAAAMAAIVVTAAAAGFVSRKK